MLSNLDSREALSAVPPERLNDRAPEAEDERRDTLLCRAARLGQFDLERGAGLGRFVEQLARPGVGAHRLAVDVKDDVSSTQASMRCNCEGRGWSTHEE